MAAKKKLAKQGILGFLKKFRPKPKPKPKGRPPKKVPEDSFIPVGVQPALSSGKEIIKKVVRPGKYSPATKQFIGKTALYGGVPAFGLYKGLTGGDDEETKAVSNVISKEPRLSKFLSLGYKNKSLSIISEPL